MNPLNPYNPNLFSLPKNKILRAAAEFVSTNKPLMMILWSNHVNAKEVAQQFIIVVSKNGCQGKSLLLTQRTVALWISKTSNARFANVRCQNI
jgi:hypothetical protein